MKVQTQTITTYVANDGTSFNNPDECQMYEKSKLPLYARIIVEQEFMHPDYDTGEICYDGYDVSDQIKMYTGRIIHDTLEMKKAGKTQDEIMVEFGLISKE